jgi:hypothetical protein
LDFPNFSSLAPISYFLLLPHGEDMRIKLGFRHRLLKDAFEEASQDKRHWDRAGARISLASALLREKPCARLNPEWRYQPNLFPL